MTTRELAAVVAPVPVPHPEQISALVRDLTGRAAEVGPARPVVPGRDLASVAVYVTDALAIGAVVACDWRLAAYAGAALGQVALADVEEALADDTLPTDHQENFAEVANVLASVFNEDPAAPDLTLHEVHAVGAELPAEVVAMLRYVVRRLDLNVEIAGYGGGTLSLVAIG
jgi:hypothetical protein